MVRDYFKMVVFYFLEVIGSLVNLVCALFSYYPRFELGVSFMLWTEGRRVNKDTKEQALRRQQEEVRGDAEKHEAFKAARNAEEAAAAEADEPEEDPSVTDANMIMPTEDTPFPTIAARIRRPK